ncbi:hypothetical protein PMAYCL1PPCAC_12246, partial [Pristionchus mayeri]
MQQALHLRRKRAAVEEKERMNKDQEEEFCFGDHKKPFSPVSHLEETPALWVNAEGVTVTRLDKLEYPSKVPSRERIICLDLRRYEGSEDVKDITQSERIISWRPKGLEYKLAEFAAAAEAVKPEPPAPPVAAAAKPAAAPELPRMKSPRPMQQMQQTKAVPATGTMRTKQKEGKEGQGSTTQVRLAPPSALPKELADKESRKAQVSQKIEDAKRHYAAAREASIMRMGTTYQIPQADGTMKEFVLAHVPVEQARRHGFIQVLPESVVAAPPVKLVLNQRPPPPPPPVS